MKISYSLTTYIVLATIAGTCVSGTFAHAQQNISPARRGEMIRATMKISSSTRPFQYRIGSSTPPLMRDDGRFASSTIRGFGGYIGSSTVRMMQHEDRQASSTENHIQKAQTRGDDMISQRITSLNGLITRIQGMKHISDAEKALLQNSLTGEVGQLGTLQSLIQNDTSTTSLKTDVSSITKSYRIFALVEPQAQIVATSDRVLSIATSLQTVLTKISIRLASSTQVSSSTTQSTITDITSKVTDATTQAQAAVSELSGLKPDNGDTTIIASNTTALKDAHTKIIAAQKDLNTAQSDIKEIITSLKNK